MKRWLRRLLSSHRALEELRQLENRHEQMLKVLKTLTWTCRSDNPILDLGPRSDFFTLPANGALPNERRPFWLDKIHPEDQDRLRLSYQQLFEMSPLLREEYRVRRSDGAWLWISEHAEKILQQDGGWIIEGISRDITCQKNMELRLQEQSVILESVINSMGDGVIVADENGRFILFNPSAEKIVGMGPVADPPEKWSDRYGIFYPHNFTPVPIADIPLVRALRGEEFNNVELFLRNVAIPDGVYISVTGRPLRNTNGQLKGGVVVIRDTTAEQKSRQILKDMAIIVASSTDAIYSTSLGGIVLSWNRAAEKLFGYASAEIIGQSILKTFPENRQDEMKSLLEQVQQGERVDNYETVRINKEKRPLDVLLTLSPLHDDSGKTIGVSTIARNNTEHKQLEEQLRQAQKMESVGRLAGGVAHDFNNMLTAILSYSILLKDSLPAGHPGQEDIDEIRKAAQHSAVLTRQLLAFSRQQILTSQIVNLNDVIVSLEKLLRRIIGEDIAMEHSLQTPLHNVKVDPGQIEQVLMNLVTNARDAMPNGGTLTIETKNITVTQPQTVPQVGLRPGSYVMFSVADTGEGMDAETKRRIFEPFFSTKERGRGTGLGLSMVYGIVKQSAGDITVTSEPKAGTCFKIYLPTVDEAKTKPTEDPSGQPRIQGTETILLVEDEELVRTLAKRILIHYGYQVLDAKNGSAAAHLSEKYSDTINLLLTDVVLPGISGPELARTLKTARPNLRVLMMSGYTEVGVAQRGLVPPEGNFLEKPFLPEALAAKVRDALDR